MRYIATTSEQRQEMLEAIGVSTFEELIETIPEGVRFKGELNLPGPLSEMELQEHVRSLAGRNADFEKLKPLVGAGAYKHFVPRVVPALLSREEFYTTYTPYQPERSQGTLQAMFEFQTYLSRLTGMEVVIPSMYDGASAVAEAVLMSLRISGKNKVIVFPPFILTTGRSSRPIPPPMLRRLLSFPIKMGWSIVRFCRNFSTMIRPW